MQSYCFGSARSAFFTFAEGYRVRGSTTFKPPHFTGQLTSFAEHRESDSSAFMARECFRGVIFSLRKFEVHLGILSNNMKAPHLHNILSQFRPKSLPRTYFQTTPTYPTLNIPNKPSFDLKHSKSNSKAFNHHFKAPLTKYKIRREGRSRLHTLTVNFRHKFMD